MSRYRCKPLIVVLPLLLAIGACERSPTGMEEGPTSARSGSKRSLKENPGSTRLSERLGQFIFEDRDLSLKRNQACVSCHDPASGFAAPDPAVNAGGAVMEGSVAGRFGNRRPPTAAYATQTPVFGIDPGSGRPTGGMFWDGRATGERLGNPAAEQALAPFTNPVEQALPDAACVVFRVAHANYAPLYRRVWGREIHEISFPRNTDRLCEREDITVPLTAADRERVNTAFDRIGFSIAAFEASTKVNRFQSRFDLVGRERLRAQERLGLELFEGRARCSICHSSSGEHPLFTSFGYANLGVPANPRNPAYRADPGFVDLGLGGVLGDASQNGAMKIPTLRNVNKRRWRGAPKSFMHNGVFKSLEQVVHFYNTRDVLPRCESIADSRVGDDCWPAPEVPDNVSGLLGDLGLSDDEERAIVAFLKTLTDRPDRAGRR